MTSRAGPALVHDIDLDFARPLEDIRVAAGYTAVFGVVRVHGVPVGSLDLPVVDGRCPASILSDAIVDSVAGPILAHLLRDRAAAGQRDATPNDLTALFDVQHTRHAGPWPTVTVAVCTRGRTTDLQRCLAALMQLDYPSFEVIVVDNAPPDAATRTLVQSEYPRVRYVCEPRPGLDWARNRAIAECRREVLAFTDDDAVADTGWLQPLVAPIAEEPDVAAVAGLVLPWELETEAQRLFERRGGLGRGYLRRSTRVPDGASVLVAGNPLTMGTGANMAFRRSVFDRIGGFDPALDAGTAAAAGGDVEIVLRVLKAGHAVVYEPGAVVRHCHRRDYAALDRQLRNWLIGGRAALTAIARRYPDERIPLAGFTARVLGLYYPRRLMTAVLDGSLPVGLVASELRGAIEGRARYDQAVRDAAACAARFPDLPAIPPLNPRPLPPSPAATTALTDDVHLDRSAVTRFRSALRARLNGARS